MQVAALWGKGKGLASAPGVTPNAQGVRKREGLGEQIGSGGRSLWTPPPLDCTPAMGGYGSSREAGNTVSQDHPTESIVQP